MTDRSYTILATTSGAIIGSIVGYLFFTAGGRRLRRQLELAMDDAAREVDHLCRTVQQTARQTSETWKALDETLQDMSA